MPRATKRATNLTLDPDAVARGESYSRRHGTSLSQLVNRFLAALPREGEGATDDALPPLTPRVRRLYGIAAGADASGDDHRAHLLGKYGQPA